MASTAYSISGAVIDLKLWRKHKLLSTKRTDNERLIERGKSCLLGIRQTPGTKPGALHGRIFKRLITVFATLYSNEENIRRIIACDISKSFHTLLENPDYYFSFFDPVVYKAEDNFDIKRSADGCLLVAAIYLIPPLGVFNPTLSGSYARYASRFYRNLYEDGFKSLAVEPLSEEIHIKKAILAVADLFLHPSKI